MEHKITEGESDIAFELAGVIPEFDHPIQRALFEDRLAQPDCIVLVIRVHGTPAGFKIGYERDGKFYSWLGGVLPDYRRSGLARAMAVYIERRAKELGYDAIWMKTRNRFRGMLTFAIQNGFCITGVKHAGRPDEHRIILEKKL